MSINTMTPADIAAVTGNGNRDGGMWGGDWSILIILFFLLAIGGWGNNRNDNPYAASAVTQADLQRGFDAQAVGSKLDSLTGTVSSIKNIAKIEAMGQEEECEDYEEHMTERLGELMKEDNLSQREREVLEVAMKMLK